MRHFDPCAEHASTLLYRNPLPGRPIFPGRPPAGGGGPVFPGRPPIFPGRPPDPPGDGLGTGLGGGRGLVGLVAGFLLGGGGGGAGVGFGNPPAGLQLGFLPGTKASQRIFSTCSRG